MAIKYFQGLNTITLNHRKKCTACGLHLHQLPCYDTTENPDIFWVGLSAILFGEGDVKMPLAPLTRSGSLIKDIELPLKRDFVFYKTNLVKCVPLKGGKIRYPLEMEMEKCFPNLEYELDAYKPAIVFLLGKQVSSFVMKKIGKVVTNLSEDFEYEYFKFGKTIFVPIHHPSYILVYKRKKIGIYIEKIQNLCNTLISNTENDSYSFTHSKVTKVKQNKHFNYPAAYHVTT